MLTLLNYILVSAVCSTYFFFEAYKDKEYNLETTTLSKFILLFLILGTAPLIMSARLIFYAYKRVA
jgi:hypothetical protein